MRKLRRIGQLAAALHVEELVAQGGDAARGEAVGSGRHEGMRHAGAGAMRQHITGPRAARRLEQAGDAGAIVQRDRNRLGWFDRHVLIVRLASQSRRYAATVRAKAAERPPVAAESDKRHLRPESES